MATREYLSDWSPSSPSLRSLQFKLLNAGFSSSREILALSNTFLRSRLAKHKGAVPDALLDAARAEVALWVSKDVWPAGSVGDQLELEQEQESASVLSTGDEEIDSVLGGGLRVGITEIAGEASSGKTQLCLQLCLHVQLPVSQGGLASSAYYMSSQSTFPTRRALQIAQSRYSLPQDQALEMLDHIRLTPAESFNDLEHFALIWTRSLAQQARSTGKPLGLLVIDSLAAPIRTAYGSDAASFRQRANDLNAFGERLNKLAQDLQLCVLVVNQVSYDVSHRPFSSLGSFEAPTELSPSTHHAGFSRFIELPYASAAPFFSSHELYKSHQAALGLVWANQVDTRLLIARAPRRTADGVRHLCVVFSPVASSTGPRSYVDVYIREQGVIHYSNPALRQRLRMLTEPSSSSASSAPGKTAIRSTPPASPTTGSGSEHPEGDEDSLWMELDQQVDMSQMDLEAI